MVDPEYVDGDVIHDTHWLSVIRAIQSNDGILNGLSIQPVLNLSISVTVGKAIVNGVLTPNGFLSTTYLTAPATGYRKWVMLSITDAGVVTVTDGTEMILPFMPAPPDLPANHAFIGLVWMYDGITVVSAAEIKNREIKMMKGPINRLPNTVVVGANGTPDEDYTISNNVQNQVEINAAIVDANAMDGGTVLLKPVGSIGSGDYRIADSIQMLDNVILKMISSNQPYDEILGPGSIPIINCAATKNATLQNLYLKGSGPMDNGTTGINLAATEDILIENVGMAWMSEGIKFNSAYDCKAINCTIKEALRAIDIEGARRTTINNNNLQGSIIMGTPLAIPIWTTIVGNILMDNGVTSDIYLDGQYTSFVGNSCDGFNDIQLSPTSTHCTVVGNSGPPQPFHDYGGANEVDLNTW